MNLGNGLILKKELIDVSMNLSMICGKVTKKPWNALELEERIKLGLQELFITIESIRNDKEAKKYNSEAIVFRLYYILSFVFAIEEYDEDEIVLEVLPDYSI
jgi:hypothetical protein